MTKDELDKILTSHLLWLRSEDGARAYLRDANLRGANLVGTDLAGLTLKTHSICGNTYLC